MQSKQNLHIQYNAILLMLFRWENTFHFRTNKVNAYIEKSCLLGIPISHHIEVADTDQSAIFHATKTINIQGPTSKHRDTQCSKWIKPNGCIGNIHHIWNFLLELPWSVCTACAKTVLEQVPPLATHWHPFPSLSLRNSVDCSPASLKKKIWNFDTRFHFVSCCTPLPSQYMVHPLLKSLQLQTRERPLENWLTEFLKSNLTMHSHLYGKWKNLFPCIQASSHIIGNPSGFRNYKNAAVTSGFQQEQP